MSALKKVFPLNRRPGDSVSEGRHAASTRRTRKDPRILVPLYGAAEIGGQGLKTGIRRLRAFAGRTAMMPVALRALKRTGRGRQPGRWPRSPRGALSPGAAQEFAF